MGSGRMPACLIAGRPVISSSRTDIGSMTSTAVRHVYLLSPHQFVLEELGRWLVQPGIPFERIRLPYSLTPRPGLQPTRGARCVVDACYPPVAAARLIGDLVDTSPA